MPKSVSRGLVLEGCIYIVDMDPKSCMYAPQVSSIPRSCMYAPGMILIAGIGLVSNGCMYVPDMSPVSDLCNANVL